MLLTEIKFFYCLEVFSCSLDETLFNRWQSHLPPVSASPHAPSKVARIAGNFVNTDILGSLEFATQLAGAKLVVVLGHTDCGAIKGAADNAQLGKLTSLLANIRPSLEKLNYKGVASSKDKVLVQKLADQNAKDAVSKILSKSEVIRNLADSGKVKVVAAMHDLGTGKISWFS